MTSSSPAVKGKAAAAAAKGQVVAQVLPPPPAREVAWIQVRSAAEHCQFFTTSCSPLVFMDAVTTDFLQYLTMQRQQQLSDIRQAVIDAHKNEAGVDAELINKLASNEALCMADTQWLAKAEEYEWDLFDSHTRECIGVLSRKPDMDNDQPFTVQSFVRGAFTYELFVKEPSAADFHPLPLSSTQA